MKDILYNIITNSIFLTTIECIFILVMLFSLLVFVLTISYFINEKRKDEEYMFIKKVSIISLILSILSIVVLVYSLRIDYKLDTKTNAEIISIHQDFSHNNSYIVELKSDDLGYMNTSVEKSIIKIEDFENINNKNIFTNCIVLYTNYSNKKQIYKIKIILWFYSKSFKKGKIMKCRNCGSENIVVADSRPVSMFIKRRRKCLDCDYRWSTYEIPARMLSDKFINRFKLPEQKRSCQG